jgi:cobalt-zinc-cadmium resistance protein CzcA
MITGVKSCSTPRAVLTTAAIAALGFFPMAINTGADSEVQRPLATVVIFGIVLATGLMLVVFPGILKIALTSKAKVESDDLIPPPDPVSENEVASSAHVIVME